jgi:hypothetical protein
MRMDELDEDQQDTQSAKWRTDWLGMGGAGRPAPSLTCRPAFALVASSHPEPTAVPGPEPHAIGTLNCSTNPLKPSP